MRPIRPIRMEIRLTNWDGRRTAAYFIGYLVALIAATVFFIPELIIVASYGYIQVGAAALLTWYTRKRALRVRTEPTRSAGPGDSFSRKGRSRRPGSRAAGRDSNGPTLH